MWSLSRWYLRLRRRLPSWRGSTSSCRSRGLRRSIICRCSTVTVGLSSRRSWWFWRTSSGRWSWTTFVWSSTVSWLWTVEPRVSYRVRTWVNIVIKGTLNILRSHPNSDNSILLVYNSSINTFFMDYYKVYCEEHPYDPVTNFCTQRKPFES